MDTVEIVIESANVFYGELRSDANGRYRSWEHCYKCFYDARNNPNCDYDYLSLQLAFYLASWGMYRGSSFLLQKDYRVHIPVVEELLKTQYDCLSGIECRDLKSRYVQEQLEKLSLFMTDFYGTIRKNVKKEEIKAQLSTTLITKILMGVLGCVPAYDRYFIEGIKSRKITIANYNIKSLLGLAEFYEKNRDRLESARKQLSVYGMPYPQMKLLDMGFWQIGFDKCNHIDTISAL